MGFAATLTDLVSDFKSNGKIVFVGASLAGLRAAEALRNEGFSGQRTIIGDEPHDPYDRPPLSKQVLKGWVWPTPRTWREGATLAAAPA